MANWDSLTPEFAAGATERWVRSLGGKRLLFAPGDGFEYSDLGYALLGDVIAKASDQTYEDYMEEHILAPLGMETSTFLLEGVDQGLLASPHVADASGKPVVSEVLPYHRPFAAANNLFSNVDDMAKLAQASLNRGVLDGKRILPESAVEQMWTAHTATPYGNFPTGTVHPSRLMIDWGYGWFLGEIAGHPAPNAGGREHGYHANMIVVPDANLAIIAMGNGPVTKGYYALDITADVMGVLLETKE